LIEEMFPTLADPARTSQGQGFGTEYKLRGIQAALSVSLRISQRLPHEMYWHCDLNCGSGHNDQVDVIGSPIAFRNAAADLGRNKYRALFVDRDESAAEQLVHRIGSDDRCRVLNCDNQEILPILSAAIRKHERNPQYAFGSVLVDPNGCYGSHWPHKQLALFAREFPRIDLVMNLNSRLYRMGRGHVQKGEPGWVSKFWPSFGELPLIFGRPHWLISERFPKKGDSFVLLVGRSMRVRDHKALGFVHMDSPEGRAILDRNEGRNGVTQQAGFF
jgi:hypothetical protein